MQQAEIVPCPAAGTEKPSGKGNEPTPKAGAGFKKVTCKRMHIKKGSIMMMNHKELVEMVENMSYDVGDIIAKEKETWMSVFEKMEGLNEERRIILQMEVILGYHFKQTGMREKDFKKAYKKLKCLQKEAGPMWNVLKAQVASSSLMGIAYLEAAEAAQGVPDLNKVLEVLVRLTKADEYYMKRKREAEENEQMD